MPWELSLLKAFRPHCENTICSVRKNDRLGRSGYRPQRWPVIWAGRGVRHHHGNESGGAVAIAIPLRREDTIGRSIEGVK